MWVPWVPWVPGFFTKYIRNLRRGGRTWDSRGAMAPPIFLEIGKI